MERVFADGTVLADPLDVQETSVGLEADPPQGGQVRQPFADAEVARVVDQARNATIGLQAGLVDVEVHAVDAFDVESHVIS